MLRLACALAVAAALAAGCGDSEGETDTQATAPQAPAPTTASTPTAPATPAPSARKGTPETTVKKRRLRTAGFDDVTDAGIEGVDPRPEAGLEVPLERGGQLSVFEYASPADARTKAAEFEKLADQYPTYFRVAVKASTAYVGVAEQPEKLDRAEFDKAVAAAEG